MMPSVCASSEPSTGPSPPNGKRMVDAVLTASRAMVAVAIRSLAAAGDDTVTLAQFRMMVVLATRGPQRLTDLAGACGVDASTTSRMCDRLVAKSLVTRHQADEDRRAVRVSLSRAGRDLVEAVSAQRRTELAEILSRLTGPQPATIEVWLREFADVVGETPEQDWSLGWGLADEQPGGAQR